ITGLDCALAGEMATSARIAPVTRLPLFERITDSFDGDRQLAIFVDPKTGERRFENPSETDCPCAHIPSKFHPSHPLTNTLDPASKPVSPGRVLPRLAPWAFARSLVVLLPHDQAPLRGFSPAASRTEREWEAKLKAVPHRDSLRAYLKRLSARPQHVGSPYGR